MQVASIMTYPVMTIEANASLRDAYNLMQDRDVKQVPVVQNQAVVGLITAQQLKSIGPNAMASEPRFSQSEAFDQLHVSDMMSPEVMTITPGTPARDIARQAWEDGVRCFLIIDGDALLGIVTMTDLLALLLDRIAAHYPSRYKPGIYAFQSIRTIR